MNNQPPPPPTGPNEPQSVTVRTYISGDSVIIDFGKPIAWIGLGPAEALQFANSIIQQVRQLK